MGISLNKVWDYLSGYKERKPTAYNEMLSILNSRMGQDPYRDAQVLALRQSAPTTQQLRGMQADLGDTRGMPEDMRAQVLQNTANQWTQNVTSGFNQAATQDEARDQALSDSIRQVSAQRQEFVDQENERKKQMRRSAAASVMQPLAMAAGAGLGAILPGIGAGAAASIMSGLGGVAGAVIEPGQLNMENITGAIGDVLSGVDQYKTDGINQKRAKIMKDPSFMNWLWNNGDAIDFMDKQIEMNNPQVIEYLWEQYQKGTPL